MSGAQAAYNSPEYSQYSYEDQSFLRQLERSEGQSTQNYFPPMTPSSFRSLHNRVDRNGDVTVVPASWNDVPRYSIPPARGGIPTFHY